MALFEELFEEGLGGPIALGIGVLILAPKVLPVVGRALRPIAKGVIKTGMSLYSETYAAVSEATGDLIAEARAELESPRQAAESKGRAGGSREPAHAS